ncbi:UbiA-like polyprenyltransferase [Anaerosolibacter sp.]|uniref:UbiA-like polyprenyltransferase n=1 Tax=Anaerosolibacter sp. TaxID=1872527 RepID=UPI0039EF3214
MGFSKVKTYGELVMFSHTLFSLPFAIIAMLWAAQGLPSGKVIFWMLVALIGARNGANALNRLVDRRIDARNPRTANRHLPMGSVKVYEVVGLVILCFSLMVLAAFMLNPLCVKLLPLALVAFGVYSYTKRFTWACHVVLGIACGGAPVGAWMAATGEVGWPSIVLGAVVTLWVAGFDIIYATQDVDFDRSQSLFSIPAQFGIKNSLYIAAFFHGTVIALLMYLYYLMNMGSLYLIGVSIAGVLLFVEHMMVSPKNLKTMKIASYNINQILSVVLCIFVALDIFI